MKAGWAIKPLGELCQVFADGDWVESKDQSVEGIRLIQTGNVGEGIEYTVSEIVPGLATDKFGIWVAAQNLLQLGWVQFSQFAFWNALNGTEMPFAQTWVMKRRRQLQLLGDDPGRFAGAHQGTGPDGGKTGVDQRLGPRTLP